MGLKALFYRGRHRWGPSDMQPVGQVWFHDGQWWTFLRYTFGRVPWNLDTEELLARERERLGLDEPRRKPNVFARPRLKLRGAEIDQDGRKWYRWELQGSPMWMPNWFNTQVATPGSLVSVTAERFWRAA